MKCFHSFGILLMMLYALPTFGSPSEPTVQTCTVDGLKRTYRLYLPEQLPNDAPLVFVLHGYGGNFNLDQHGLNEAADRHGFAVCYPQGEKDGRGKPCWNVGYPFQADMTIDDVSFLCKLADQLQKKHRLSKKNTFCTGMSNGGEMCYLLAYTRPDVFAAVAPISGLTLEWTYRKYDAPVPIPLFEIHGTQDRTSAWEGDLEKRAAGEPICPFRSQSAIGSPQTAAPANRPIRWRYAGTPWWRTASSTASAATRSGSTRSSAAATAGQKRIWIRPKRSGGSSAGS